MTAVTFPIAPLRLSLRSAGMTFPAFSGSLWRGGLGMTLERRFRPAFDLLYGGSGDTRLYALLPPQGHQPADSSCELRLSLFGPATRHILACTQAIAELGERGIRSAGHYRLEAAAVITPAGDVRFFDAADGLIAPPRPVDLRDYVTAPSGARCMGVNLRTPMRLKEGNKLLESPPEFSQLIHRLLGRLQQLAHVAGMPCPLPKQEHPPIVLEASRVVRIGANLSEDGLSRRSGRTGQRMTFEGLHGSLRYHGDFSQTLPWLMAGRWLHLGGKSTFGFGAYDIDLFS